MTINEAREIFTKAASQSADAAAIARIELAREFFTNPTFRKALEDHVWAINQERGV